jgi:predicted nucleic acid-binding protein
VLETAAAIRGRRLGGKIDDERAVAALRSLRPAEIVRVDTAVLLDRVWELRANLTAYDAAYIAAAEALGVTLLTGDQRLAAAPVAAAPS